MAKEMIKVSLTEFMNFVNKSGSAKLTVVSQAKIRHEDEYQKFMDYWLKLRESIKRVHRKGLAKEELFNILEDVSDDKKENYANAISGYCQFLKNNKVTWVQPPRKTWAVGNFRVELNPELGLIIKGKTHFIKLFLSPNDKLDKRHADLILTLMEHELREKVESNAVFGVLDIKRGKMFVYQNNEKKLYSLLKAEAQSFETIWLEI